MSATLSAMLPLGTKAPNFRLTDTVTGKEISLDENGHKVATVIMFICNHCPYIKHIQYELVKLANDYTSKGISFIAISSNDVENYPEDSPQRMKEVALQYSFPFPYLYDKTQEVARNYQAACTPDFYIFDKDLLCVYRGQFDDSRPGNNIPVSGKDIRYALECLLEGTTVPNKQIPSIGCNIKWKKIKYHNNGNRMFRLLILLLLGSFLIINAQSPRKIKVTFKIRTKSLPADSKVYITGSSAELGNWQPDVVAMEKKYGGLWTKTIAFTKGQSLEFKFTLGAWEKKL